MNEIQERQARDWLGDVRPGVYLVPIGRKGVEQPHLVEVDDAGQLSMRERSYLSLPAGVKVELDDKQVVVTTVVGEFDGRVKWVHAWPDRHSSVHVVEQRDSVQSAATSDCGAVRADLARARQASTKSTKINAIIDALTSLVDVLEATQ